MVAYLINMHLLVPRSSAKVKVKYKGYISQKIAVSGVFMFHKHILFVLFNLSSANAFSLVWSKILSHGNGLQNLVGDIIERMGKQQDNVAKMVTSVFYRKESILGKGENAAYQHFLLFPQCFQKPLFFVSFKNLGWCGQGFLRLGSCFALW